MKKLRFALLLLLTCIVLSVIYDNIVLLCFIGLPLLCLDVLSFLGLRSSDIKPPPEVVDKSFFTPTLTLIHLGYFILVVGFYGFIILTPFLFGGSFDTQSITYSILMFLIITLPYFALYLNKDLKFNWIISNILVLLGTLAFILFYHHSDSINEGISKLIAILLSLIFLLIHNTLISLGNYINKLK